MMTNQELSAHLAFRSKVTRMVARQLKAQQKEVDNLVLREPTGPDRDKLTAANIHIMTAIDIMKDFA